MLEAIFQVLESLVHLLQVKKASEVISVTKMTKFVKPDQFVAAPFTLFCGGSQLEFFILS